MSPAGNLFDESAALVKKLEGVALTLGRMVDIVRSLTMAPLSANQRALVAAAFERVNDEIDPLGEAARGSLARLRKFIEETNQGGTKCTMISHRNSTWTAPSRRSSIA